MKISFISFLILCSFNCLSQNNALATVGTINTTPDKSKKNLPPVLMNTGASNNAGIFNLGKSFIENIGQYGDKVAANGQLGKILYGYEGMGSPVLFTINGLVYLQQKAIKQNKGNKQDAIPDKDSLVTAYITMQWEGANLAPTIITEGASTIYHTFGLIQKKARAFNKITLKEIYPGIDVVYSFAVGNQAGFEYSLIVRPGADISRVKLRYGGDIATIKKDEAGNLQIGSAIGMIKETAPISFYQSTASNNNINDIQSQIVSDRIIKDMQVEFHLPQHYDKTKTLVIDPFVTSLGGFTGVNDNIAYDIDYDYEGNIYVRGGGGNYSPCQLAKYDKNGNLLWVFHGTLTAPSWIFGHDDGGWVVEKSTGKVYACQGVNWDYKGFQIIRLDNAGLYDNYISTANTEFNENWKMLWVCNGGNPQIFAAGGGVTSNSNFGICVPPSPTITARNITGIPILNTQDIGDVLIDPADNAMYSIFFSYDPHATFINNRMYKHTPPYDANTIVWSAPTGYTNVVQGSTRPFTNTQDNTINCLAVNPSYLFYWDGKYLLAFDKATGASVGTPLIVGANALLMQAGIVADACNDVFVGDVNGTIKVYKFNGSVFDDAAAPDITIPGFSTSSTYALSYDIGKKLIYACGQGYVGAFDISSYCASQVYSINVNGDCITSSIAASLSPAPPTGSTITYNLYSGSTFVSSNTSGVFSGLTANIPYTIRAVINIMCSGAQTEKDFVLTAPAISTIDATAATCTQNIGTISVAVASGTPPYTFSIDGINFQNSNSFSNLAVGNYTVTLKDASGCADVKTKAVPLSGVNTVTVTPGSNETICEGSGVQLKATSNATSFSWTPVAGLSDPSILNPVAKPTQTTKYYITAASTPCTKTDSMTVFVNAAPIANAGNNTTICNGKSAQLDGSGGVKYNWSPATYLDNANIANPNVLLPLSNITYALKVTDNNSCTSLNTATVQIIVKSPEKLFVGNDTTIVVNQPLQLNAVDVNNTGFVDYTWLPNFGLDNNAIKTPIAILAKDISYMVTAHTAENCVGTATINIKVVAGPQIYVPNAFTPNGDGKNDLLKAFPIGLKEFKYFAVFNRYGQRVFYTNDPAKGWDGTRSGKEINRSGFVWVAEGTDFRGNSIKKQGSVILIR